MIPKGDGTKVHSTVQGESITMGLHAAGLEHIMKVLTDLYSDPQMAVLREYSTNAYDSHIQAGVTRSIEVELPSALTPTLKIRDYGIGLDIDDIREIYSQYGASTKRSTNDLSGVLGLGCKSALTYVDQFTFIGIKDGIKTSVLVSREAGKPPTMTAMKPQKTTEHNGVEVRVPVERNHEFDQKAEELFRYWPEGSVLVNGEVPKKIEGIELAEGLLVSTEAYDDIIVMGNVPYPINREHRVSGNMRGSVVAWVDMGKVSFTPSREDLTYDDPTLATLKTVRDRAAAEAQRKGAEYVQEASDKTQALVRVKEWARNIGSNLKNVRYNNQPVPDRFFCNNLEGEQVPSYSQYDGMTEYAYPILVSKIGGYREGVFNETWYIRDDDLLNSVIVYNFKPTKMTIAHKRKVMKWLEEQGMMVEGIQHILFTKDDFPMGKEWLLNSKRFVSYPDTIKKLPIEEKEKTVSNRLAGSYQCYVNGEVESEVPAEKIDTTKKLFFYVKTYSVQFSYRAAQIYNEFYPGCTIVELTSNRIKKFQRDFPMAVQTTTVAKDICDKIYKNIPKEDLESRELQSKSTMLAKLDPKKIEDSALRRAVELARKPNLSKHIDIFSTASSLLNLRGEAAKLESVKVENPLTKYPLVDTYRYGGYSKIHNHTYAYINHIYALRAEGQVI